jgi:hypothetical protein
VPMSWPTFTSPVLRLEVPASAFSKADTCSVQPLPIAGIVLLQLKCHKKPIMPTLTTP